MTTNAAPPPGAAVITGAGQGIGYACAERLGANGQPVVLVGRTAAKIEHAEKRLQEAGVEARGVVADVTDPDAVTHVFEVAMESFGAVQAVVNSAGIFEPCHIDDMSLEVWNTTIGINLTGSMLCAQAGAGLMDSSGRIVNVSSISGALAERRFSAYNASKTAIIGLTRSLAIDLAERGIRANAVAPGWVYTEMTAEYIDSWSEDDLRKANPLGRVAKPGEIAELIAFLCRPDVDFITGQTIWIDGGQTIMSPIPGES